MTVEKDVKYKEMVIQGGCMNCYITELSTFSHNLDIRELVKIPHVALNLNKEVKNNG